MSEDGERTCPLCAEEMDLTDQQLKPCKCGYEICVWCWHHIIEMAEKDDIEARCPACRTAYDKDRVIKMASTSSERIMAEVSSEKKQRSQRAKPKISPYAMKHLSGVRVMQKNLVYITGLPANLCNESILERKEYFGQHGKVIKISISHPAGTSSQKISSNNTFGVYITYTKEEEAVRCIQATHNYVLEGKSLRACFGTTKYCRAWLRNMICSNPDCLYLHDIGSQEDSFTKDEIISAYTRSTIQQTSVNNSQRRSGNLLPSMVDDFGCSGIGSNKHPVKNSCNNASSQVRGSLPNSSLGKSNALPVATSWGLRGLASSVQCTQTLSKHKVLEISKSSSLPALPIACQKKPSAKPDEAVIIPKVSESNVGGAISGSSELLQLGYCVDSQLSLPLEIAHYSDCSLMSSWDDDINVTSKPEEEVEDLDDSSSGSDSLRPSTGSQLHTLAHSPTQVVPNTTEIPQVSSTGLSVPLDKTLEDKGMDFSDDTMSRNNTMPSHVRHHSNFDPVAIKHDSAIINGGIQRLALRFSSVNVDSSKLKHLKDFGKHQTLLSNISSVVLPSSQDFDSAPVSLSMDEPTDSEPQKKQLVSLMNDMEDLLKVHNIQPFSYLNHQDNIEDSSISTSSCNGLGNKQPIVADRSLDLDRRLEMANGSFGGKDFVVHNGHRGDDVNINTSKRNTSGSPGYNFREENMKLGQIDLTSANSDVYVDETRESIIISDILSLDFDPWDNSISSSNILAKLLGETQKQDAFNISSSLKSSSNNQSRFSFARKENQSSLLESPVRETTGTQRLCSSLNSYKDSFPIGFQFNGSQGPCISKNGENSSDRCNSSGVVRANMAVPPGFVVTTRAPPPGFSSQNRFNQAYEMASSGENHYQSHSVGHSGDLEFLDPAILAIGKSQISVESNNSILRSNSSFPSQFINSVGDQRLHLMSQQVISSHQNMSMPNHLGETYSLNDAFNASQLLVQRHTALSPLPQLPFGQPRNTVYSNNHWDAWNSMLIGTNLNMGEVVRNDRIGLSAHYRSTDENKIHIPSAGDLYNRAFGL
ncbi:uncharacterized protein LOC122014761 isoform X1 [Zingiber officinale]|uniref:uncharacterized protein LOC122014761 isoform X1 n=1 Tax=Zingiber officinale TaxID=94328 RepID=UPI001C4AD0C5|nr:uncharacterized protein LOC122014761 isoform X1 [Zingiber officinale]XP_042427110.1 uncharacterized protein LOC122014761 isoform X1 [Zingiber officinale]XP_042427111.1 uncharacterized protein LOC122014761 isoform X1 [Zingiber officinale]